MTSPGCPSRNIATNFGLGLITDWPDLNLTLPFPSLTFHSKVLFHVQAQPNFLKYFNYIELTFLLKAVIEYQVNVTELLFDTI